MYGFEVVDSESKGRISKLRHFIWQKCLFATKGYYFLCGIGIRLFSRSLRGLWCDVRARREVRDSVVHCCVLRSLHGWHLQCFDATRAFLHGRLTNEIFMRRPPPLPPGLWRPLKSIYGLKQSRLVSTSSTSRSLHFPQDMGFVSCSLSAGDAR